MIIMGNVWSKFNDMFDMEALAKDIEEVEKNGGNYEDVPPGVYEVAINKLEATVSKKGDPMVTCWMKVVAGEHSNRMIFMNQVVTKDFQFGIVNDFLRSLVSECDNAPDIHFGNYKNISEYADMIMEVGELIDNRFEYKLEYGKNKKGYDTFKIEEVYPLED